MTELHLFPVPEVSNPEVKQPAAEVVAKLNALFDCRQGLEDQIQAVDVAIDRVIQTYGVSYLDRVQREQQQSSSADKFEVFIRRKGSE